jgi:hypothetical protein
MNLNLTLTIRMKTILLLVFGFIYSPFFAHNLSIFSITSQTTISDQIEGELVIGVPNFNMKRYDNFVKEVTAVSGIKSIEFCSSLSVFMINYDSSVYDSPEAAFRAIEIHVKGYQLFHKIGTSHAELKKDC